MDIATLVFSHVQCVKTRVNLALVSKSWRDASKPAAAYPDRFDFDAFPDMHLRDLHTRIITTDMLDNDEVLSLPYERVIGLLGEAERFICDDAASRGSIRLLKWTQVNNLDWGYKWGSKEYMCQYAALNGHLPALKYLHENGCPWNPDTCWYAAQDGRWDCLQYAVDNKCPDWKIFAETFAKHLR